MFTENVRGLKRDEDLEAALASVGQRGGLAACWQETWRSGNERLECPGIGAVLLAGRDQQICNRGQEGVGIALSPAGMDAWKQAGQVVHDDLGSRVMAVRLAVKDEKRRELNIFLVSAYAPTGDAAPAAKAQFFTALDSCIERKAANDILVIGMDGNSSVGNDWQCCVTGCAES